MSAIRVAPYSTRTSARTSTPSNLPSAEPPAEMPAATISDIQAALSPLLDSLKTEITTSHSVGINNLHEALLKKIVELTETVNQSAARITTLENQLAHLKNEQRRLADSSNKQHTKPALPLIQTQSKPTAVGLSAWGQLFQQLQPAAVPSTAGNKPAEPHKSATKLPQHELPAKPEVQDGFQLVSRKKQKKKVETLVQAKYPLAEREIILSFTAPLNVPPTDTNADIALEKVNKVIVDHKDILQPPFTRARFTVNNNLVLTTGLNNCGMDYDSYLNILVDAVRFLGHASARVNERWSKFLVHGVPVDTSLETIRHDIESNYPSLKLAQTPRWLAPAAKRVDKTHSTIVIALLGSITLQRIGVSRLTIRNRPCRISEYVQFGASTQCTKCQLYGHHTLYCQSKESVCAVCAGLHTTKDHPCKIQSCKAGPLCTHPPIKCAACSDSHKANDPNCPTRVKLSQEFRLQRAQRLNAGTNMETEL